MIGFKGKNSKKAAGAYEAAKESDIDPSSMENPEVGDLVEEDDADATSVTNDGPSESLLHEMSDSVNALRSELAETKDKYLRLLAEFDNFRKRTAKERAELIKYQGESILTDIVDVLDDLERALKHAEADPASLKEGLDMVHKRFVDTLAKWEIRGESATGSVFDPNVHLAISKVAFEGAQPNTVIDEFKKPYFYKDKLLRPGQVVVAAMEEVAPADSDGGSEA